MSDRDFGYPLQPSELAVERDLELSARFTYSEEYERWLVHRTRTVITGTSFLGSRSALAQEMWCPRAELDRYPRAGGSVQCFCSCNTKSLREMRGAGYFGPSSRLLPLDPRLRL